MTLEEHRIWALAHYLWYYEPLVDERDTGPKRRHFARARLIIMFQLDMQKIMANELIE